MKKVIITVLCLFFLWGCQAKSLHTVVLTNDQHPLVTSKEGKEMELRNLTPGESYIYGYAEDGEHPVSLENVTIDLYRVVQPKSSSTTCDNPRCNHNPCKLDKYVLLQGLHLVKTQGQWWGFKQINIDKFKTEDFIQEFRYIVVNYGEKEFFGDLVVYGYPDPTLRLKKINSVSKVKDQRAVKQGLSAIPFVGLFALAMDNYEILHSDLKLQTDTESERYKFVIQDVALQQNEGLMIEYLADFDPPLVDKQQVAARELKEAKKKKNERPDNKN